MQVSDTMARKPAEHHQLLHPCRVNQCDPAYPLPTRRRGLDPGTLAIAREVEGIPDQVRGDAVTAIIFTHCPRHTHPISRTCKVRHRPHTARGNQP